MSQAVYSIRGALCREETTIPRRHDCHPEQSYARRDEVPAASMRVPLLDLTVQYRSLKAEIHRSIDAVLGSQRFVLGSNVHAFEAEVAQCCHSPHAIGVASGTDALLLA